MEGRAYHSFMRKQLADQWALQVLEQIDAGGSFETGLVELKRESKEFDRLARQLGGAANAAQMDPVLLLVGVDQSQGIVGTVPFEIGDWIAQLRSRFEYGHAPHLAYPSFIRFKDKTVGVFVFETDDAPYVISGGKKGSACEVPWRYGSSTGPAGRAELLRILLRRVANPEVEVQKAEMRYGDAAHVSVTVEIFLYPSQAFPELAIPLHRIDVTATDSTGGVTPLGESVSLAPRNPSTSLAKVGDGAVIIPAPSRLKLHAVAEKTTAISPDAGAVDIAISFRPAHFIAPVTVRVSVQRRDHPDYRGYWELSQDHGKRLQTIEDHLRTLEAMAPKRFESPFPPLPRPW